MTSILLTQPVAARALAKNQTKLEFMAAYNVHEAETSLSKLLERVEEGEEVVIARHGTPVAKLVPVLRKKRVLGTMRGLITPEENWDAPIDDREAEEQFGV